MEQCCLCIFVASKKSVESSWCGAELGAFWGAGKPILVYLAEASMPDELLPQIVQGDVWERRLAKIADRAREIHGQNDAVGNAQGRTGTSVANLTVEQFEKMIHGAVSLAAATALTKGGAITADYMTMSVAATKAAGKVLAGFQASEIVEQTRHEGWQNQILWVDDCPDNNTYLQQAMEAMGLQFTLALSTEEALRILANQRFAAIISDMGRREGPREYGVHGRRGLAAIDEHGILAKRTDVLVHDCWAPYWRLEDSVHALCNAHLLRELLYVKESTGQAWPQTMSDLLLNANKLCTAARQQQIAFSADDVLAFRTVYDDIVREGERLNPDTSASGKGRVKQSVATNLLRRFRLHADAVLRFIGNFDVPLTNNVAERAVRMPKVKQKISGCFRTLDGAEHFCVIRSCLDTLRKQGHNMLAVLQRAFAGDPIPSVA